MTNEEAALRANFLEQTRQGKMSLITLLQNLPSRSSSHLPDLQFDANDRYVALNEDHRLFDHVRDPSWQVIERDRTSIYGILQQRTRSGEEEKNLICSREEIPGIESGEASAWFELELEAWHRCCVFASVTLDIESTTIWSTRSCFSAQLRRRRQTIWTGIEESVGNTSDSHASSGHRCDRCTSYHDRWRPTTKYRAERSKTSTHHTAPWWTGNLQSTICSALLKRLLPLMDTREIRKILGSKIIDWLCMLWRTSDR